MNHLIIIIKKLSSSEKNKTWVETIHMIASGRMKESISSKGNYAKFDEFFSG